MNRTLITLGGATGIGKTSWAIRLAKHYKTQVLSADSRQFYREIPIGTAAPTESECDGVAHHFIGHLSVDDTYSVGAFRDDALGLMRKLFRDHDLLILVGGSGLYLDAVVLGLDEFPETDTAVRGNLNRKLETEGIESLQLQLAALDPAYYQRIDLQNPQRLIRALEVCLVSGRPYSSFLGSRKPPDFFQTIRLGLDAPREVIYNRINERVSQMMQSGLEDEARAVYPKRNQNALQTVGYQELFKFFDGEWDRETAVREIAKNTRRYAKRQGTWLRRQSNIHWIPYNAPLSMATEYIDTHLAK